MIKDEKYAVDMDKVMIELRRHLQRCRECTAHTRT